MKIYIAHNYGRRRGASLETLQRNVNSSIKLGLQLIKKGHIPIIPLLYHYVHLMANDSIPESVFIEIGNELVKISEALLVATPPMDKGSDIYGEISIAEECGYPVYYSLDDVPDISGDNLLVEQELI